MATILEENLEPGQWHMVTSSDVTGGFKLQNEDGWRMYVKRSSTTAPTDKSGASIVGDQLPFLAGSLDMLFPGMTGSRLWVFPISRTCTILGSYA